MMHMVIEKQLTAAFHAALSPVEQLINSINNIYILNSFHTGNAKEWEGLFVCICMYIYIYTSNFRV